MKTAQRNPLKTKIIGDGQTRKSNRGYEFDQSTIYAHMEISQ
jgi:hypothetical protein